MSSPRWRPLDTYPPEVRLLLLATRPAPSPATKAAIETLLAEPLDWNALLALAGTHRVTSGLYHGLVQPYRDALPVAFAAAAQAASFRSTVHHLVTTEALHAVLDAFDAAGIDVLCLKGLAVGALAYGEAALRKSGDLDLLIRRSDFQAAREALVALDYRPDVAAEDTEAYLGLHHGYALRGPKTDVDLHWNLAHLFQNVPTDFEALHARRLHVDVGGRSVPTLAREDHLLQLANHAVTHCWRTLYLIADIAALLNASDHMDWDRVLRDSEAARSRRAIALAVLLAVRLYGAAAPPALADAIAHPAVERLAARVQTWLFDDAAPSLERFVIHRFYLETLDGWNDRTAYLTELARRGLRLTPSV